MRRWAAIALACALAGCASVGMVSTPYAWRSDNVPAHRRAHPERLITYRLPMTVVELTAIYEIRRCDSYSGRLDQGVALVSLTPNVSVRGESDPQYWYDIDPSRWSGFAVALQEAKLELSDGVLTSVNFRSDPQASQLISAAIRVASLGSSSMGGSQSNTVSNVQVPCSEDTQDALRERSRLRGHVAELDAEIASADTMTIEALTDDPADTNDFNADASKNAVERRTRLIAMRDAMLQRILSLRDESLRFSLTYVWTPRTSQAAAFPTDALVWRRNSDVARRFSADADINSWLRFTITEAAIATPPSGISGNIGRDSYNGVFYRTPARVRLHAVRDGREIALPETAVLQYGDVRAIAISGSPWVTRSRGATWRDGGLTSVSAGSNGATGPAALGAVADLADAERSVELARLARETAELQALTNLEKAREAYEETQD